MRLRPETWLPERWRKNFLVWEFWLVVVLTAALVLWGRFLGGNEVLDSALKDNRAEFYTLLASVFGALFGFIIAATSIVLSVSNKPQLYLIRRNNDHRQLWDVLFSSIKVLGLATVLALLGFLFDTEASPTLWLTYVNLGMVLYVIVRLVRCVWVLEHVVRIVGEGVQKDEEEEEPQSYAGQGGSPR